MNLAGYCRLGCVAALGFAATTTLTEGAARGEQVAAQLDYVATPACPGAGDFEAVVARRLGYRPFRQGASDRVVVSIEGSERALEGRLEWRNAQGEWIGERTFVSRSGDCGELVRAMGFALALQIQLMAATAPPAGSQVAAPPPLTQTPVAANASATPIVVAPASPQPAIPPAGSLSGPSLAAGAGASVMVGAAPDAIAVGRLFGTAAWSFVAVELGAEISVPSSTGRSDGTGFSERLLLGTVAGCGLLARWSACVVGKVGEIRVVGEGVDVPTAASAILLQGGLRLAMTQMLGRRAHVVIHAAGLGLLTRGTVTLNSMPVWTAPRVAGELGLDLAVRFR